MIHHRLGAGTLKVVRIDNKQLLRLIAAERHHVRLRMELIGTRQV